MNVVIHLLVQQHSKTESQLLLACGAVAPKEIHGLPHNENLRPQDNKECHCYCPGALDSHSIDVVITLLVQQHSKLELLQQ